MRPNRARSRLARSPGRRRTSRSAFPVNEVTRTRLLGAANIVSFRGLRGSLLDEPGEDLVPGRLVFGHGDDADPAVAEGATLVRVGTAIFGPRPG